MLVAVTGGTGFLGAHTVKAVSAAGHDVRLLVYPADSLGAVAAVGVDLDALDVLYGDVCDPAAVDQLLTGADAVIHAAGVVGVDERQAELIWWVNVTATQHVLATAVARGLDPVVHVASFICLFNGTDPVITADTATASGRSAYARTKGAADTFARGLQAAGAPWSWSTRPGSPVPRCRSVLGLQQPTCSSTPNSANHYDHPAAATSLPSLPHYCYRSASSPQHSRS